jgi:hypothetical protein
VLLNELVDLRQDVLPQRVYTSHYHLVRDRYAYLSSHLDLLGVFDRKLLNDLHGLNGLEHFERFKHA